MSDSTEFPQPDGAFDDETQPHHPRHRRDDAEVDDVPLLKEFDDDPDTSLAG